MTETENRLTIALQKWDAGQWDESICDLRTLVRQYQYMPAYPEYLWRIWGDGRYYDEFIETLERGIALGSADCEYIKLWKEFSNRPSDDEYWQRIESLSMRSQPDAMLAVALDLFLKGMKTNGIDLLCNIYSVTEHPERVRALKEVRSFMYSNCDNKGRVEITKRLGATEIVENVRYESYPPFNNEYVEWFPYRYLYNEKLSNEEFNGTVFSKKRMLERKRMAKQETMTYEQIKDAIIRAMPDDVRVMDGLTKNSWMFSEVEQQQRAEQHSAYLMKRLPSGKYMTLRIANHTMNTGDYYKYRRMYVPSSLPYANMCIMFHGDREQNAEMKYSFRFEAQTADPCVTVRDADYQVYRPFMYTIVHYIPGLITDLQPLIDEILAWFDGFGEDPFCNPYEEQTDEFPFWKISDDNPTARITGGLATIETWDLKYERRRRQKEGTKWYPDSSPVYTKRF